MNQTNQNQQLKKEIQLHCPTCQTLYQLLEIHTGKNDKCADNCLTKWQQLLQDYHSKEIMAYLAKQEEENDE